MKVNANSIRVGNIIEYEDNLWNIISPPEHTKPGKGPAYIQVVMKNVKTGTKLNTRFNSSDMIERVRLDQKDYQFLFMDDDLINLMDIENYEQITIDKTLLGEKIAFLEDGMILKIESYEETPLNVSLPDTVVVIVSETEPVIKGQTAAASYKPALLENGFRVMVPPFVNSGDKIVIKTEDFSYVERAKG